MPCGISKKSLVPFGINKKSSVPFGISRSPIPLGISKKGFEPFGISQNSVVPLRVSKKSPAPSGISQKSFVPFGVSKKGCVPFDISPDFVLPHMRRSKTVEMKHFIPGMVATLSLAPEDNFVKGGVQANSFHFMFTLGFWPGTSFLRFYPMIISCTLLERISDCPGILSILTSFAHTRFPVETFICSNSAGAIYGGAGTIACWSDWSRRLDKA